MNAPVAAAVAACHRSASRLRNLVIDVHDPDGCWDAVLKPLASAIPLTRVENADVTPDIRLEVLAGPASPPVCTSSAKRIRGFGCCIVEDDPRTLISLSDSWFSIDARRPEGVLCIHPGALTDDAKSVRDLVLIGINELLAKFGLFDLHAAALAWSGVGLLLVGGSCSGKSTTAVALACRGWDYLSDDAVLLRSGEPVAVHGFRTVFSVDPRLAEHFPELRAGLGALIDADTGKHLLDTRAAFPGQHVEETVPTRLVFTSISDAAKTVLEPLDPGRALTLLVQQSPSLAFRRRHARQQMALLGKLVRQGQSFALRAGRDVREDPARLEPLISDAVLP